MDNLFQERSLRKFSNGKAVSRTVDNIAGPRPMPPQGVLVHTVQRHASGVPAAAPPLGSIRNWLGDKPWDQFRLGAIWF